MRVSSSVSMSGSISKGGVSLVFSTRIEVTATSTSPVGIDGVLGALRAVTDVAGELDDPFGPHALGERERLRAALGVERALHDAAPVAQIDEDETAMIASLRHPAGERHRLADVAGAKLAGDAGAYRVAGVEHAWPFVERGSRPRRQASKVRTRALIS